jgi:hypothetical protein
LRLFKLHKSFPSSPLAAQHSPIFSLALWKLPTNVRSSPDPPSHDL